MTENNKWYTDEFVESMGRQGGGDFEPMSDKQNRYSHVRIVENNEARTVIHWRYAQCECEHYLGNDPDPLTGWTDWADEYFTVYPDGVAVRKDVAWTTSPSAWHEFQETIVINGAGTRPEDNIKPEALTIANMDGESDTYTWRDHPPVGKSRLAHPNIQVVNLQSLWKPFQIVPPRNCSIVPYTGEKTFAHVRVVESLAGDPGGIQRHFRRGSRQGVALFLVPHPLGAIRQIAEFHHEGHARGHDHESSDRTPPARQIMARRTRSHGGWQRIYQPGVRREPARVRVDPQHAASGRNPANPAPCLDGSSAGQPCLRHPKLGEGSAEVHGGRAAGEPWHGLPVRVRSSSGRRRSCRLASTGSRCPGARRDRGA